jgi:hypothetical protein
LGEGQAVSPVPYDRRLRLEQVFQGTLTDDQFERLANVLVEVKKSKLLIESPDGQPGADAGAGH